MYPNQHRSPRPAGTLLWALLIALAIAPPSRAVEEDDGEGLRNAFPLSMTQPYAAGSMLSTVDDLARWDAALFGGRLLEPTSLQKMMMAATLNDGTSANHGYGLSTVTLRGLPALAHGGGIFGFSTLGIHIPDKGVYVAVLSNNSAHEPETADYMGPNPPEESQDSNRP